MNVSVPNDLFYKAESIANNAEKRAIQTIEFKNELELNILDKYKQFIWFAISKDTVQMEQDVTFNNGLFPSISRRDVN